MNSRIEARLTHLEKTNRRSRIGLIVLGSLGAAVLAGGAAQPDTAPALLRAQRFELATAAGQKVAEIAFNSELGCGEITTFASDGTKRVWLGGERVQSNGAIEIYGKTGKPLAGLYASDETGSGFFAVNNAAGQGIHYLSGDKNGNASTWALNNAGKLVYSLGCTTKSAGWINVASADGTPLVRFGGADEDGNGVLLVGRADGKPAAQLKGYKDHSLLSLFDGLGRVRMRVASTSQYGGRVGVYTTDDKAWAYWPEKAEFPSGSGGSAGPGLIDEILRGGK